MRLRVSQLKELIRQVVQEETEYQEFFKKALDMHGVDSPADFKTDEEKKEFFNWIEKNWKKNK